MNLTTHRHIQIHNLIDTCEALASKSHRAATNALSINNTKASRAFQYRALRLTNIINRAKAHMGAA